MSRQPPLDSSYARGPEQFTWLRPPQIPDLTETETSLKTLGVECYFVVVCCIAISDLT